MVNLQSQFPLEDQVDLVAYGSQEEVFFHLEGFAGGLGRCNDFVFTEDGADVKTEFEICKVHACAVSWADGEGEEVCLHFGGFIVPPRILEPVKKWGNYRSGMTFHGSGKTLGSWC